MKGECVSSVSYTHLDVYKRQPLELWLIKKGRMKAPVKSNEDQLEICLLYTSRCV